MKQKKGGANGVLNEGEGGVRVVREPRLYGLEPMRFHGFLHVVQVFDLASGAETEGFQGDGVVGNIGVGGVWVNGTWEYRCFG